MESEGLLSTVLRSSSSYLLARSSTGADADVSVVAMVAVVDVVAVGAGAAPAGLSLATAGCPWGLLRRSNGFSLNTPS